MGPFLRRKNSLIVRDIRPPSGRPAAPPRRHKSSGIAANYRKNRARRSPSKGGCDPPLFPHSGRTDRWSASLGTPPTAAALFFFLFRRVPPLELPARPRVLPLFCVVRRVPRSQFHFISIYYFFSPRISCVPIRWRDSRRHRETGASPPAGGTASKNNCTYTIPRQLSCFQLRERESWGICGAMRPENY